MRHAVVVGFAAAVLSVLSITAQAAPVAVPGSIAAVIAGHDVMSVSGGCGARGYRAANGRCYPRRPPPPRARRCGPRFHLTPYGCRRNY